MGFAERYTKYIIVRDDDGKVYTGNQHKWRRWSDDLGKAKMYATVGHARNAITQGGVRLYRDPNEYTYSIYPVACVVHWADKIGDDE